MRSSVYIALIFSDEDFHREFIKDIKKGIQFHRLDDPKTNRSFRLSLEKIVIYDKNIINQSYLPNGLDYLAGMFYKEDILMIEGSHREFDRYKSKQDNVDKDYIKFRANVLESLKRMILNYKVLKFPKKYDYCEKNNVITFLYPENNSFILKIEDRNYRLYVRESCLKLGYNSNDVVIFKTQDVIYFLNQE